MTKEKKIIIMLVGIILGMLIGTSLVCKDSSSKTIKKYIGEGYVTTYHPSDSSQNGYETASGHRATSGRTVAVGMHKPIAKMGSWIYIEGVGKCRVEDVGGFDVYKYDHGNRVADVFKEDYEAGFKKWCKVYIYRKETKKEKQERLRAERRRIQKNTFTLIFDPLLAPWQVVTYAGAIKGGTFRFDLDHCMYAWLDVVSTKKGKRTVIYTGDRTLAMLHPKVRLADVFEEAVG